MIARFVLCSLPSSHACRASCIDLVFANRSAGVHCLVTDINQCFWNGQSLGLFRVHSSRKELQAKSNSGNVTISGWEGFGLAQYVKHDDAQCVDIHLESISSGWFSSCSGAMYLAVPEMASLKRMNDSDAWFESTGVVLYKERTLATPQSTMRTSPYFNHDVGRFDVLMNDASHVHREGLT